MEQHGFDGTLDAWLMCFMLLFGLQVVQESARAFHQQAQTKMRLLKAAYCILEREGIHMGLFVQWCRICPSIYPSYGVLSSDPNATRMGLPCRTAWQSHGVYGYNGI